MSAADEAVAVGRGLDEHHRRKIIEVPVARKFPPIDGLPADERLHPLRAGLDSQPWSSFRRPRVIRLKIVVPCCGRSETHI